jgi:N-dimethylarginine dimethylaminohydrolase
MTRARFLMCPPDHFDVEYEINPWMSGNCGTVARDTATAQFAHLFETLSRHAHVETMTAQGGLPDMVFTANAGVVLGDWFVPSNFAHAERQGERDWFARWFGEQGHSVVDMPMSLRFEGAGDALFDADAPVLWMGHGFRSDLAAANWLEDALAHEVAGGVEVLALKLADPRYYHLDTCFCPLANGMLLWNPSAFDMTSQALVHARVPAHRRIAVGAQDAASFACNAVSFEDKLVLNHASNDLVQALERAGIEVFTAPLGEFMKSGGAAKCLTLRLDTTDLRWMHRRTLAQAA